MSPCACAQSEATRVSSSIAQQRSKTSRSKSDNPSRRARLIIGETDPDPLVLDLDGTVADPGSVSTPGVIEVTVTRANTLTLLKGVYEYGQNRIDAGVEDVLAKGPATVALNVRDPK